MSSVIFQPLLHDPLGWKPSNSTYTDHYKWRKYRSTSKDKKVSTYGQKYQRQLQKQQKQTNQEEQTNNSVILVKKTEDNQERPNSNRSTSTKTPTIIVEYKQRPTTANEDTNCQSKVSQRSQSALPNIEERTRPLTAPETRHISKEEKEKPPIDPNNDNSRHWLTYPNPKTPDYIIDIKKRLGQLKISSTLARPLSASNVSSEQQQQQQQQTPQPIIRPTSASTQIQHKQQTNDDQHHFLTFRLSETPDDLRARRYRIDKHRYNPSIDNYPPRPKTCPVRVHDTPKPITPKEFENEQIQQPKNDVWIVEEDKTSNAPNVESSSILIQMVDCDGLPNEYVEALETANAAQEEYLRNLKMNVERRPENPVYRLSAMSPENKNDALVTYSNQQQSTTMNNQLRQLARTSQNDFGVWVRNATDKERASAMKILQDVLNQPIVGYENQTKQKSVFKQPPAPPPVRTASATRKLGRTRTQHQFPCEICEKLLIKRHVWDLSGSETVTCPHHPQSIQVRA
ncbi:unnamed protein product [Rotaria sp. Silwood1]|nr:unnamed protein product [Rotaria sp. Silwood1]CAF1574311.1 unnamed protein product [Rotaria sp. Silwood1]CAF3656302.1 unnamed protein product [Rotaria sp. Silwood1]CAF3709446.1 unnamed protein product [Rotaria sp. Silwood1]CAF4718754.1 unnamed protein product [Rotaria sp. Silwood1]